MDAFAPAEASVIWLHLVALELAAGALAFLTLVVKPRCQGAPQVWGRMICGSRRLAQISIAAAAATLFAWLWLAFRGILDSPSQIDPHFLASFILKTQFGRSWLVRLFILLAASVPLLPGAASRLYLGRSHLALCVLLLVSLAFSGHMAAGHGVGGALVHAAHLAATAAWVGSLPPLALLLHQAGTSGGVWAEVTGRVVRSYALYGTLAVLVLLGSGVTMVATLGDGKFSWTDDYSRTLMAKLALFGAMGMLGLGNRFVLTKRVVRGDPQAIRTMRAMTVLEFAIALAVLFLAAALSQTSPP